MNKLILILAVILTTGIWAQRPDGNQVLRSIDNNLFSGSVIATTQMVIHSRRASRTVTSVNYIQGVDRAFTEYLSPPREKGTKMLKLGSNLWIYDPNTDRTIQISGNMLKQSVMGSDLSYEDFMEETSLADQYSATITGETKYLDRDCWILKLTARRDGVSYPSKMLYVDKERLLPLYEEWYASNGRLLKSVKVTEVARSGSRWYPKRAVYKDELKEGKGTEFIIVSIEFDAVIAPHIFTRGSLRK